MALSASEFKGRFGFGAMRLPMKDGEPDYELCNQIGRNRACERCVCVFEPWGGDQVELGHELSRWHDAAAPAGWKAPADDPAVRPGGLWHGDDEKGFTMRKDKLFMDRRAFVLSAGLMGTSLLAGCGAQGEQQASVPEENDPEPAEETEVQEDEAQAAPEESAATKTLVVFYSRADENYADGGVEVLEVGHTKVMAGYIVEALGADLYEIVPSEAYPFSYDECCDQASDELKKDVRPALAGDLPDVSGYDTVFLGCPIWWGSEPMVVRTFLDAVDLSGKTVVPFTTHGGSGLGNVPANLQARVPGATFVDGKAVAGTAVDGAHDEVVDWVTSLDLA